MAFLAFFKGVIMQRYGIGLNIYPRGDHASAYVSITVWEEERIVHVHQSIALPISNTFEPLDMDDAKSLVNTIKVIAEVIQGGSEHLIKDLVPKIWRDRLYPDESSDFSVFP